MDVFKQEKEEMYEIFVLISTIVILSVIGGTIMYFSQLAAIKIAVWLKERKEPPRYPCRVVVNYGLGRCGYRNELLAISDFLRSRKSRPRLKIESVEYL